MRWRWWDILYVSPECECVWPVRGRLRTGFCSLIDPRASQVSAQVAVFDSSKLDDLLPSI